MRIFGFAIRLIMIVVTARKLQAQRRSVRGTRNYPSVALARIIWLLPALLVTPFHAFASTYLFSAPHLTTHVGDPIPPLIFRVTSPAGDYATRFIGEPSRSTAATSTSPVGNYPIHVSQGSLKSVDAADHATFQDGTLSIIAADSVGAQLSNGIAYPPGFLGGPVGHAAMDVTKNPIANLVGDCTTDNAQAIETLLSQNGIRTRATTNGGSTPLYLYFPPGCYATSQPLTIYGNSWTMWGAGPQVSYIRLLPHSPTFNTGHVTQFFSPQSVTGNSNFREYIYNLGFNIGVQNPDAIPVTTVQNNSGAIRNVQIWADDSTCPYGISFARAYPGPMLLKNVAIYGCAMAYSAGQPEYNITFEGLTTEGQTTTVLDNRSIKASIRHWLSDNEVMALHAYGTATSNIAVLNSELFNGSPKTPAIQVDKGSAVYLADVRSTGYLTTESDNSSGTAVSRAGAIKQAWTGTAQSVFNGSQDADALHLEVRETPLPADPPVREWTRLSANVSDWPTEISRARSSTVYAAAGTYTASGTTEVTVSDNVNHLEFYQSKFNSGAPKMILTIPGTSKTPLLIDGCPYEACLIRHTGKRTVVIRDSTLHSYTSRDGSGDLFVEDSILSDGANGTLTVNFFPSQHIWARQLNLEQKAAVKLACAGCSIWILGYKTEQSTPSIVLRDGAQAEIFGFFFYQNAPPNGAGTASIYLTDSSLFATGWTKVDIPGRGQPNWIIETQNGQSAVLATHDVNTSQQLGAFFSYGSPKSVGHKKK